MEGTGFTLRDEVSEMGSETRPSPPHITRSLVTSFCEVKPEGTE